MNRNLFKLALERLQPSDWQEFEQFVSCFLVTEYPTLRTMAHTSGDGGRDSELYQPDGKPFIVFQYSLQKDWRQKIRNTAARLTKENPNVRILIYLSNHQIGAKADDLKTELLEQDLSLDVRDRNWFLERACMDESRQNAAEQLIDQIARPYLVGEELINKPSSPLTTGEARAALLYLGLQWQDDITEKGLTKLSFDALVRAALRHTHSKSRMTRTQVHQVIFKMLPSTDKEFISRNIDSALLRLTKRYIRHWKKEDEFCLTYEEHQRILIRLAEQENEEAEFNSELARHCEEGLKDVKGMHKIDVEDLQRRIPRIIEKLLLKRGEAFVTAIVNNSMDRVGFECLEDIVIFDINSHPPEDNIIQNFQKAVLSTVRSILAYPKASIHGYLRRLADSYTLFTFLNEIPDVQSATRKLFSHGKIWLDTTVLLPLYAEQLEEDETLHKFTRLFKACHEVGIELRVTPGIIQEVNSHMNTALACSKYFASEWRGRTPYLYYHFLKTGKPPHEFKGWLAFFRGRERPEDDIEQYLGEVFSMKKESLYDASQKVEEDLRLAAQRLWSEAHRERRQNADQQIDDATTQQLIKHDLETYLGVIALRKDEQVTELGYRHWLLTFDKIAWGIRNHLREEFEIKTPQSPLLSVDFLVNNLAFGPDRRFLSRKEEQSLPIVLDIEMSESMPHDILYIAEKVRLENEGLPEYVIRRKVRDAIDRSRRHRGRS